MEPTDLVTLPVVLKNVKELIVNVYEVSTSALYQTNNPREASPAAMNVDGLIPNFSRTIKFDKPALRRHTQVLTFPEMGDAGATM